MSSSKRTENVPRVGRQGRQIRVGKWIESLKNSDVNQLWADLHRVVCSHPLARASKGSGLLVEEGRQNSFADLTQELFVALLSKERFHTYLDTGMTNAEIEAEISQIELTNLLTAELRKRYPESYRLARRISTLIQTSPTFKRIDNIANTEIHRRLADRVFGLAEWSNKKSRRNPQEAEQRVQTVAFHSRDTRFVGCSGDSQIVISNPDLEKLIVRVLKAIDSPMDIRTLRSLVMSRLPVMDIYLVPIGGSDDENDEHKFEFEPVDVRETPEQDLLRREAEGQAIASVEKFLVNLNKSVRGKVKQYNRMINVLWHCYLSADGGTQLEVAAMLGVSDSLVSDYRRRIETNLQELSFSGVGAARQFENALRLKVKTMIPVEEKEKAGV
jgi:hypothetical protein